MDNDDYDLEILCPYKKIILERENGEIAVHNITNAEQKSPECPQLEDNGQIFSEDHNFTKTDLFKPPEPMEECFDSKSETETESEVVSNFIQEPSCEKQNYSEGLKDFHILDEVQGDSDNEDGINSNLTSIITSINFNNVFLLGGSEFESSGSEVNYDDIESMLDERLPEELRNKRKDQQYEERFKTIMEGNLSNSTYLSYL